MNIIPHFITIHAVSRYGGRNTMRCRLTFLTGLVFVACLSSIAVAVDIRTLAVVPAANNYYLASLTGESEYYDPSYYDDYTVLNGSVPVIQYTRLFGRPVDCYFYETDHTLLAALSENLGRCASMRAVDRDFISAAIDQFLSVQPEYAVEGLHVRCARIIEEETHVTVEQVISRISRTRIDRALYRYLWSNGVSRLDDIRKRPELVEMMVGKFYLLSTTCFYREWYHLRGVNEQLPVLARSAAARHRPLKLCVFACSTGEEVLTYAVELAEAGITDFTILASDINESSLSFARRMRYGSSSFNMLPMPQQAKLKKYFIPGKDGFWEPADPAFFQQRIRYISHDILKPLPADLESRFAPPYDLLSILNVLMYLDDRAVQKAKNSWPDIIVPGGILILHDARYSVFSKKFGERWGMNNFLLMNEWVNLRLDPSSTADDRLAFYERRYTAEENDLSFSLLVQACMHERQMRRAQEETRRYLERHPGSVPGLSQSLELEARQSEPWRLEETVAELSRRYAMPSKMLPNLISIERNGRRRECLAEAKQKFDTFIESFRTAPVPAERAVLADRTDCAIGDLMRIEMLDTLQEYYRNDKRMDDFVRVSTAGIALCGELLSRTTDYVCAARFLDNFTDRLTSYDIERGMFDEARLVCGQAMDMVARWDKAEPYFYILFCGGNIRLAEACAADRGGDTAARAAASAEALRWYAAAAPMADNLNITLNSLFFGKWGHAFFLACASSLDAGVRPEAEAYAGQGIDCVEKGLAIAPMYAKYLIRTRTELLSLCRREGLLAGRLPEDAKVDKGK